MDEWISWPIHQSIYPSIHQSSSALDSHSRRLHEDGLAAEADLSLFLKPRLCAARFFFQQRRKNEQRELRRPRQRSRFIRGASKRGVQFRIHRVVEQSPQQTIFQFLELSFLHSPKWLGELRRQFKSRFGREPGWHGLFSCIHFFFLLRRSPRAAKFPNKKPTITLAIVGFENSLVICF